MEETKPFDTIKRFSLSKRGIRYKYSGSNNNYFESRAQQTKLLQQPFKVRAELNKYPGEKST
jgi:hypothetical protein